MKFNLRRLARLSLIAAMILICFCSSAMAQSYSCKINASTKVYKRASTSSPSLKVSKNTKCTMKGVKGSWALIERSGTKAYIPVKYLTLTSRITAYASKNTAMYKRASASSSKLGTLPKGTAVYINGRDGSFFRCQNKSGSITGYVKMSHLSEKKPSVSSSGSSSSSSSGSTGKIGTVIDTAESLLGRPYASSANPPKSFDCSRFVKYCFDKVDVSLSGSAKTQGYASGYERITKTGSLKRGDVVVFNTNASDSDLSDHTGIYLGSGYFIHASSSAGKVIKSSLSSGYYERTFSWGLRIIG